MSFSVDSRSFDGREQETGGRDNHVPEDEVALLPAAPIVTPLLQWAIYRLASRLNRKWRVTILVLASISLLAAITFSWQISRIEIEPVPEDYRVDYFYTGDVVAHNAEVSARLARCAALGLLRNTKDPIAPLDPPLLEQAATAHGCGINETTLIILSSRFMYRAFSDSPMATTGEAIWARSFIASLNRFGYSYIFTAEGRNDHDMKVTMDVYHRHRDQVRLIIADHEQVYRCWNNDNAGCLKTEHNADGIPVWKMLSFHYFDMFIIAETSSPGHPLGASFTLSPTPNVTNHFVSYSIEQSCRQTPYIPTTERIPPQAYILAKQAEYLSSRPDFAWTIAALGNLIDDPGIRVVGGLRNDDQPTFDAIQKSGIVNLGHLTKDRFYEELSKSFVLIGVGPPRLSPSPWDALCVGVPFINPILEWDIDSPDNRSSWAAQHQAMIHLDSPYVYNIKAHDLVGLKDSVVAALENPIGSFVPPFMRLPFVSSQIAELLNIAWRRIAEKILEDRQRTGDGDVFVL